MFLQDDVYTRVLDLEDEDQIFQADLYYHKSYLNQDNRAIASSKQNHKVSRKLLLFMAEIHSILELTNKDIAFPLSDIHNLVSDKCVKDSIPKKMCLYLRKV